MPNSWTTERWLAIEQAFASATELPAGEQIAYVQAHYGHDPALCAELLRLLAADATPTDGLLDGGAEALLRGKDALLGARFGAFRLVERIAEGGMGWVYRAERVEGDFAQDVAVKVLRFGLPTEAQRERFARERRTQARLVHPNVVRLLDGGTNAQGVPFMAMERIDGLPVTRHADSAQLTVRQRVELFIQICRAVHFAHQNLVVHLDLKPSNVLVDLRGAPKLLDFGVAALLEDVGDSGDPHTNRNRPLTPDYASPEQLRGDSVSTASDVYSLGAMLHELLTGRLPRELPGASATAQPSQRPLSGDLAHVVQKALRTEPKERYASCEAFASDLQRHLLGFPVEAIEPSLGYRLRRFVARNRVATSLGALVVLALAGGLVVTLRMAQVASLQRDRADLARAQAEHEMAHARIEATSSGIVASLLGDTLLSSDFVSSPDQRARLLRILRQRATQVRRQHVAIADLHLRANLLDAIGRACQSIDAYEDAETLLRESRELRIAQFGAESLEHAMSLGSLGKLEYQRGRLEAASAALQESYRLHTTCPPGVHTDVAMAANDLAAAERSLGHRDRARELHEQALRLRRGQHGDETVAVAESLNNLANCARTPAEAIDHLRQAQAIRTRLLGIDDPLTLQSQVNLARASMGQGDLATAEPLLRQAIGTYRNLGALGSDGLAQALLSLAQLELRNQNPAAALQCGTEALQLERERFGDLHPRVALAFDLRAAMHEASGDRAAAIVDWREALRIRRSVLPTDHRDLARSLTTLGTMLANTDDRDAAVALLEEAVQCHLLAEPPRPAELADVRARLVTLYTRLGRPADAARHTTPARKD
ncbi:MAG: serine/threonine protein kinase [Planctomycetes bacterium]|jgi:tetratricopeptide (TPR) repeat protein|nr:serine/threonine protein kinase [Planctomycetota bacterium]